MRSVVSVGATASNCVSASQVLMERQTRSVVSEGAACWNWEAVQTGEIRAHWRLEMDDGATVWYSEAEQTVRGAQTASVDAVQADTRYSEAEQALQT